MSGMRVRELCTLPCDCLVRHSSTDWFLRYHDLKSKQERFIYLSSQAVMVVQKQQALRQNRAKGTAPDYLFLNAKGQPYTPRTFLDILNRIAREREIRDETGNIWRFGSLQFQHTVMTHMIRSGDPLDVLHRYLGYRTQEMAEKDNQLFDLAMYFVGQERLVRDQQSRKEALLQKFGYCNLYTHLSPCPHTTYTRYNAYPSLPRFFDKIKRLKQLLSLDNVSQQQEMPREDDSQAQQ